jgi:hypothetical protein
MNQAHRLAKVLLGSWTLGGDGPSPLPTAYGLFDRVLQIARERNALPGWFWAEVHFAESRVGLRCVELPEILNWAQSAELTDAPGLPHRTMGVKISPAVARRMLADLQVTPEEAARWGQVLREAARLAAQEFAVAG